MSRKKETVDRGGVNLSYIITPFLDMSFQLLAFFIMTYHPSALEGHIDGKLVPPSLTAVKANKPVDDMQLPPDSDPDLAETVLVQIKSVAKGQTEGNRHDGEPSQIKLKQAQDAEATTVSDASDATLDDGLKKLEGELKRVLRTGAGKANVKIEGDGDLKHMYVMRVFDVCKAAGFQNVSFVAPALMRKAKD